VYTFKKFSFLRVSFFVIYENVVWIWIPIWGLLIAALMVGYFLFEMVFSLSLMLGLGAGWKVFYFLRIFFILFFSSKSIGTLKIYFLKKYFFSNIWFLNKIINNKLGYLRFKGGGHILNIMDGGWLEIGGPQGAYGVNWKVGIFFFRLQNFIFFSYFFVFVIIFILFLTK